MLSKELMVKAHQMTKEIKAEYPNVNYNVQLGLCISYLLEEKGEVEMVELKGSEKQIKWANDIRKATVKSIEKAIDELEALQTEIIEKRGKRTKLYDRKINAAKEALECVMTSDSSKFFIDEYSWVLNVEIDYSITEFMNLNR